MSHFGRLDPFDETVESWTQYSERADQFFLSNDVKDEAKKRALLLTVIGPAKYGVLRSLVAPSKPADVPYQELVNKLSDHYNPRPSEIVERYRFNTRVRKQGESIAIFISELRRLAQNCNYEGTLNTMLRDRFVCGVQDSAIQRKLLAEPMLTLNKAVDIALAMETAAKDAVDLQVGFNAESPDNVNAMKVQKKSFSSTFIKPRSTCQKKEHSSQSSKENLSRTKDGNGNSCIRCGSTDHKPPQCPYIKTECNNCGKIGHLARSCLSSANGKIAKKNIRFSKVNTLPDSLPSETQKLPSSDYSLEYEIFHMAGLDRAPPPVCVTFMINGMEIEMELDSGAAYSLIPLNTYNLLKDKLPVLKPCQTRLLTYTGQHIEVAGYFTAPTQLENIQKNLPLIVVVQGKTNLCGRNWIQAFNLLSTQPGCINKAETSTRLAEILEKHKAVFEPGLGLLKDTQVHLSVRSEVQPRFFRPHSVPFALRDKVHAELDRMQAEKIIEPNKTSEWATPIVPVLKKDKNSVRICGEIKLTANLATETEQYPLPKV